MRWVNGMLLVYALLLLVLGAYGYFEKGSVISVAAGGVAALLVLGSLALYKTHPRWGRIAAAVIALLMLGQFMMKAITEHKWHQITLAVSSAVVVLALVGAHFAARSAKKSAADASQPG